MIDLADVLPSDPRVLHRDATSMLVCAKWQDVIADLPTVDAVITDPPYSERTHAASSSAQVASASISAEKRHGFKELEYDCWTEEDADAAARAWHAKALGWLCVFSDHSFARVYETALEECGRYVFAPIAQVTLGRSVRLAGDGPATWTTWITVARPRFLRAWGALPGAYVDSVGERVPGVVRGAKQESVMRALVRDYSRPGDLILDPCAGGGTTGVAAKQLGRQSICIEMDPVTAAKAAKRIAGTREQMTLAAIDDTLSHAKQLSMG